MNRRTEAIARQLADLEARLGVDEATRARCRRLWWLAVETMPQTDEDRARCRQFAAVAAPMNLASLHSVSSRE